jgi:hypothetical protein
MTSDDSSVDSMTQNFGGSGRIGTTLLSVRFSSLSTSLATKATRNRSTVP